MPRQGPATMYNGAQSRPSSPAPPSLAYSHCLPPHERPRAPAYRRREIESTSPAGSAPMRAAATASRASSSVARR